jgi:hypothetical protein
MSINQFQMTGDVNVIIRALGPTTINGSSYIAKEVITSFTGDVVLNYNDVASVARTNKNELAKNDVFANSMRIIPKQLNESLYNLIGRKLPDNTIVPVIKKELSNENGIILLNRMLNDSFIMLKKEEVVVSGYTVDYANGTISGLENETEYKIFAYQAVDKTIASYSFENVPVPYVMIELVGKSNINGAGKSYLIRIPKASMSSAPQLDFTNDSIINITLDMVILNSEDVELHYY